MPGDWTDREYTIRRRILTLLGAKFEVFDANGDVVLFSRQKAFKLREDIRIYSDETQAEERLSISARQIVDFSAAYDVVDSPTGKKLGALRRKGWSSLFRDSWEILNEFDDPVAKLQEDSMLKATLRRFLSNLIPQSFHLETPDGRRLVTYQQAFNPFVLRLKVRIEEGAEAFIDPRVALAAGILLAAIEGRQSN